MSDMGRVLIGVGTLLLVIGAVLVLAGKLNLPWGRLPGDISYRGKNTVVYFPLASSIILSILISFVFWLFSRHGR